MKIKYTIALLVAMLISACGNEQKSAFNTTAKIVASDPNDIECVDALNAGNYVLAEEKCSKRAIEAEKFNATNLQAAVALFNLGESLRGQKKFSSAENYYLRAVLIQEKLLGTNQPEVGLSLLRLGESYNSQKNFAAAEPLIRRATAIFEQEKEQNKEVLVICFDNLAISLDGLGRTQEAADIRKQASNLLFKR